jgi:hypothetical protein
VFKGVARVADNVSDRVIATCKFARCTALRLSSGARTWIVLDQRGVPIAKVVLAASLRLKVAERHRIWAVDYDADGLPSVVRFDLRQ